jgi:hypothetical protein
MNPVKCPNCRLSLPQNWSGMNDPNAKCPYCGKPITATPGVSTPGAPLTATPSAPAPRPAAGAKTILWGVGAPIPGVPGVPAKPAEPAPPVKAMAPTSPVPVSPTVEPPAPVAPEQPASFHVEPAAPVPAASTVQAPSRPNQPAATVMYEPGASADVGASPLGRSMPEPEPPAASEEVSVDMDEPEPSYPARRPTPSRSKAKVKPAAKRGPKPRKGWSSQSADDEDEDQGVEPERKSSKTGLIIFLACLVAAIGIVAVVALRGKSKQPSETAAKPEPLRPAEPEPAAQEEPPVPPPAPQPAAEKPSKPEKPAAAKATVEEKPAHKPSMAEKPADREMEKPKEEAAPKPAAGKPTEADYQRANELYQQANAKLFQGDATGAITDFSHALKLNPRDPAMHRGLGLAYAQAGKKPEAIKHLKAYLKEAPKATDRGLIEKRLDQLQGK